MAITIKNYNFSGNTARVLSVYNPITFVVDSTLRSRADYKYVADIYYSGNTTTGQTFITRLDAIPNLNNFYGLFDVHRPLESIVSSDKNFDVYNITEARESYYNFNVKFGDSFSTTNRFSSVASQGSGPYTGYLKLNLDAPHSLTVGDRVWIDKDSKATDSSYDGNAEVLQLVSSTAIVVDRAYGTGSTSQEGNVIEGTEFFDTYFQDGKVAFPCTNEPNVQVGDTIVVDKDLKSLNPSYDGQWTVTRVWEYLGDTVVTTNIPWGSNSTLESGMFYIKGSKMLTGLTTSIEYSWVLNSVNDYDQIRSFGRTRDFGPYSLTSSTNSFLTSAPTTIKVQEDDYHTFSFLSHASFLSRPTQIRTVINYTTGGTQTYDFYMGSKYASSSTIFNNLRFDVGVGPANINAAISNSVLSGTAIDFSTVDSIDVYAYLSGSTAAGSKTYTLEIDTECSKYDTYRFMWLNRLGAFDYYNFRKRSDTTYDIDKSAYERKLGRFAGDVYGYEIGDRGKIVNSVKINEKVSVNSDWVTEEESAWLFELFQSPEVYVIEGDNIFPIVITNNSYTLGKKENQKLFNYRVDFQYAFDKFSQRG